MKIEIVTIGVYGFTEEGFFQALIDHQVDTFCDVRQRRGRRGAQYAFANSQRLQERLKALGIRYHHFRNLAPSQATRAQQKLADKDAGTTKRARTVLSPAFIAAYTEECLSNFDSREFLEEVDSDAKVIAFFCVERDPTACHRSLVAEKLAGDLAAQIKHITP